MMGSTSIIDLPTEIIESFILPRLTDDDVRNFGKTNIRRFEEIAYEFLKDNKCK